jgi:hypothetical protein
MHLRNPDIQHSLLCRGIFTSGGGIDMLELHGKFFQRCEQEKLCTC